MVVVGLLLFVSCSIIASCECKHNKESDVTVAITHDKVASWLSGQPGFFVHPSLVRGSSGDFMVKEGTKEIQKSEVLMVIPSSAIISGDRNDDPICNLFDALWKEFELKEESHYAPYIQRFVAHEMTPMPSTWSFPGRRLLTMVTNGSPNDEIVSLIDKYMRCLEDDSNDSDDDDEEEEEEQGLESGVAKTKRRLLEEDSEDDSDDSSDDEDDKKAIPEPPPLIKLPSDNRAMNLSEEEKLQKRTLEIILQQQIDQLYLVPFYDDISHHHYDYNVIHRVKNNGDIQVEASGSLKSGDVLTRRSPTCLKDCQGQTADMLGALKLFGQVQRYPRVWEFPTGVSFVSLDSESIQWIRPPTEHWQLKYMEAEIARQENLLSTEIAKSQDTVRAFEFTQAVRYSHSVRLALTHAVEEGRKLLARSKQQTSAISPSEQAYLDSIPTASTVKTSFKTDEDSTEVTQDCNPMKDCSVLQIGVLRGCSDFQKTKPSGERSATEWHSMRTSYVNAVGPEKATIQATAGSGYRKAYKVKHSPGRGRGVFALEDIPKGSLIWTTEYTAWFEEGDAFRRFLEPLADDIVCDLLMWCYTIDFSSSSTSDDSGKKLIGCDLDAGKSTSKTNSSISFFINISYSFRNMISL